VDEAQEQQQHHGADKGVEDCSHNADAEMNAEPWQQPVADERADKADEKITNKSEAAAVHDTAGKPAGHDADQDNHQQTLIGQMHETLPTELFGWLNAWEPGWF